MNDLKELQEEIRWLKDELSAATNIDDDLENIKDDISEIKSDQRRLFDAYSTIAVHINQHTEALKKLLLVEVLTPKPPPSDMLTVTTGPRDDRPAPPSCRCHPHRSAQGFRAALLGAR
jgi:hypothetical protein